MLFSIAFGGAMGTLARYGVGLLTQRGSAHFPYGTLAINVAGSLLLGVLARWLLSGHASPELRAGLTIGFCGGFTTFSAFSFEVATLLEQGSYARAGIYAALSVLLSVMAMFAGFGIARAALAGRV